MSAGAAAPSAPLAGVSLASLFSSAATAPALAAAPDAEKSGGAASAPAGSAVAASLTSIAALMLPSVVRAGQSVGLGGIAPGVPAPAEEWNCGMNSAQRFLAFGILLVTSLLLYVSAIFVFLPMVIFMPSKCVGWGKNKGRGMRACERGRERKTRWRTPFLIHIHPPPPYLSLPRFATTFTFASIAWMAAFAILRGPRATLLALVSDKDKRIFTLCYLGSLLLTLYTTIFTSSYLLALVAIVVQVSAMMWYTSSSIPGGTAMMSRLSTWCLSGLGTSVTSYLPVTQ